MAAKYACDKHVVKMLTETIQIMSTSHRMLDGDENGVLPDERDDILYKKTHANHPCCVWARESDSNHEWLWKYMVFLEREYYHRFGQHNPVEKQLHGAFWDKGRAKYVAQTPTNMPKGPRTPFHIGMKQHPECIVEGDPIESYRNLYRSVKREFAQWKNGSIPEWLDA